MKRISIVLVLTAVLCLVFASSAFANFGPHGGYVNDTDSCAGCHRAHSSFSSVTWTDGTATPTNHTALLVGSAQTMVQFCEACHGDTAPGASTNVVSGVFDSGPSADVGRSTGTNSGTNGANVNVATAAGHGTPDPTYPSDGGAVNSTTYQTASTFNAPLNGGGFVRMPDPYQWEKDATTAYAAATSAHQMGSATTVLWGAGTASDQPYNLDCSSCHDPHGTSNYRLLKASVNGQTVGGYQADGVTPNAFIFSNETGYPLPGIDPNNMVGGWLKHQAGQDQMAAYRPNYTETNGTPIVNTDNGKSMSVWCSACHENYDQRTGNTDGTGPAGQPDNGGLTGTYQYTNAEPLNGVTGANPQANAGDGQVLGRVRHRHPVDISMGNNALGNAAMTLTEKVISGQQGTSNTNWVPLEHNVNPAETGLDKQYIGCLTCHRAHGSSVTMAGFAAAHLAKNGQGIWAPVQDGVPGVDPIKNSSTLLRANNRGVCERCHNK